MMQLPIRNPSLTNPQLSSWNISSTALQYQWPRSQYTRGTALPILPDQLSLYPSPALSIPKSSSSYTISPALPRPQSSFPYASISKAWPSPSLSKRRNPGSAFLPMISIKIGRQVLKIPLSLFGSFNWLHEKRFLFSSEIFCTVAIASLEMAPLNLGWL